MDLGVRARHVVLISGRPLLRNVAAFSSAWLLACCKPAPPPRVAPTRLAAPAAAPRRPASSFFLNEPALRSFAQLGPSVVSRGHQGGRYRVTIFANALGTGAFRARAAIMPKGAVFVAVHVERGAGGARGPVLVMKKLGARAGDWLFAFADAALHPLRQGRLADCARCHATAAHDDVFTPH